MTNPGELALATIGVSAIVDGDIPKMGIERTREALSIPKRLPRLANMIVDADVKRPPLPRPHSYRKLLDHFAKGLQPHHVQELIAAFPPESSDMGGAFLMVAQQAIEHLRKLFPMSVYSTFTGPQNLTPDDVSVWTFFSQLQVLDDPLRVYPLIATGSILRSQVLAAREIYPTLSEDIDASIYEAIAKATARAPRTPPFRLSQRAELGVANWLGRRIMSHVKPEEMQDDRPAIPAAAPPKPDALATRNQKAIEGT